MLFMSHDVEYYNKLPCSFPYEDFTVMHILGKKDVISETLIVLKNIGTVDSHVADYQRMIDNLQV